MNHRGRGGPVLYYYSWRSGESPAPPGGHNPRLPAGAGAALQPARRPARRELVNSSLSFPGGISFLYLVYPLPAGHHVFVVVAWVCSIVHSHGWVSKPWGVYFVYAEMRYVIWTGKLVAVSLYTFRRGVAACAN